MAGKKLPPKFQVWADARKKFRLSHAQVQMARELGLNPKKFGSLANSGQERWKVPLPDFIEELYFKHFKKERPDEVMPIEGLLAKQLKKKQERKACKQTPAGEPEPDDDANPF